MPNILYYILVGLAAVYLAVMCSAAQDDFDREVQPDRFRLIFWIGVACITFLAGT